ncbi:MAG: hypothetical protein DSY82_00055 [Flavobacteriia bacterium]|nr:MAG: hypothetical protein DSY82_00055 [Flavobacteriia bacterium]
MKKILIIILGIAFLSGCSNDDDALNDQIIGKWKLIEVEFYGFGGQGSTDYSHENIIYDFQPNGILKVTGGQNEGYSSGEYNYFFGLDYLGGGMTDPKVLLVRIEDSKWTYNLNKGIMRLGQSYLDGPVLIFERK